MAGGGVGPGFAGAVAGSIGTGMGGIFVVGFRPGDDAGLRSAAAEASLGIAAVDGLFSGGRPASMVSQARS